jgi:Tol biopolymer transport system component
MTLACKLAIAVFVPLAALLTVVACDVFATNDSPAMQRVLLSANGKLIAVDYSHDKTAFIYLVSVETGGATRLTQRTDGNEAAGAFSADGSHLAYTYWPPAESHPQIYIRNLESGEEVAWDNVSAYDFSPKLSPDGKTVVFSRSGHFGNYSPIAQPAYHAWDFWAADRDGHHARQITKSSYYGASPASISNDGKQIAFLCVFANKPAAICLHSLLTPPDADTELRPHIPHAVSSGDEPMNDPNFTTDGKSILLLAANQGKRIYDYNVFRVDLATQSVEQITQGTGSTTSLTVSGDGKTAAMLRWQVNSRAIPTTSEVWLLDLTTHKMRQLTITGLK